MDLFYTILKFGKAVILTSGLGFFFGCGFFAAESLSRRLWL